MILLMWVGSLGCGKSIEMRWDLITSDKPPSSTGVNTAEQTGDIPVAKQVVQVFDIIRYQINICWTENRRRSAVIVPSQRVGEP